MGVAVVDFWSVCDLWINVHQEVILECVACTDHSELGQLMCVSGPQP